MTEVERTNGFSLDRRPPPTRPAVDLHKDRGLDLTPVERVARRQNRRWMLTLTVGSIIILGAALIASGVASSNQPTGPKLTAPPGYKVVNDSYFAYVVPDSWANNPAFTDQAGDVDTSGPSGWAGENISYFKTATPTLGETNQPRALQAFGMPRPEPYTLSNGRALTVKGASGAYEYDVTRPGGFHAVAVDAWSDSTDVELWLMVYAPPDVTAQVLSSLVAGESK